MFMKRTEYTENSTEPKFLRQLMNNPGYVEVQWAALMNSSSEFIKDYNVDLL